MQHPLPPQAARQHAELYFQQGLACHARGELNQAHHYLLQALAQDPLHVDALHALGVIAAVRQAPKQALDWFEQALALDQHCAMIHNSRGNVCKALNRTEEALQSYQHALALDPSYAEAWFNRGLLHFEQRNLPPALDDFTQAIALRPDYVSARINRALTHIELHQHAAAQKDFERVLRLDPAHAEAHLNYGKLLATLGHASLAQQHFNQAIASRPDYAEAWYNRGTMAILGCQYEAALSDFEHAIALAPHYADAWNNKGLMQSQLLDVEGALASYNRAIALAPEDALMHTNRAQVQMLLGAWEEAWAEYEWRLKKPTFMANALPLEASFHQPRWDGRAPLEGKTLLVQGEQGLGDVLQYCRYAVLAAARGARVVLRVRPGLVEILKTLEGVAQVISDREPLPAFDLHCSTMSLPNSLKTEDFPLGKGYLRADPTKLAHWQRQLGQAKRPRIGIVWCGSPLHDRDRQRSMTLEQFLQCLPTGCDIVSLKQDISAADHATLAAHPQIRHFGDVIQDFGDTAALCQLMDLVVSVDTSVAHLAGALGKPTWLMITHWPDSRWMLKRADTPWYTSMRLFRQHQRDDWSAPLARVHQALCAWLQTQKIKQAPSSLASNGYNAQVHADLHGHSESELK